MPDFIFENKHFSDLNPINCGFERCKPRHKFGPAIRDYYLIHYVVKGQGLFQTAGREYTVRPGMIFIINRGERTFYQADGQNPWEYIWIGFDGALSEAFGQLPPVVQLSSSLFFEMREARHLQNTKAEFLTAKLFMLYSALFESQEASISYAKQVADFIENNYMKRIYIEEIARNLKIDRRYLSKLFRAEYGVSLQQYIIDLKMRKASELLLGGYQVKEVADMVGYEDAFNFSKIFKKNTGFTPSGFKRYNS